MSAVGRNAPCTCGSGKKYKRCCALKQHKMSVGGWAAMSIVGLMLLAGVVIMLSSLNDIDSEPTGSRRVWSAEHGHWH